jgi:site-specific DNA recombinase
MNAVGYIRISVADQSRYSLDYQEKAVKDYCELHKLQLVNIFKDDGESSYTFDRPDFKALEKFIKQSKNIQYLIIFDHDRFSRNLAEALIKIKELKDKLGITVLATTDAFNTDYSDPSAFLMRAFKYMMAESELHRIRQRTKTGLTQAALQGRHVNRAPYGYTNAKDDTGRSLIVIDDEKAIHVRAIYREFLLGNAAQQIRKLVTQLGYKQNGTSAIQRILSNCVYAGLIKIPGKKEYHKGLHDAIISEKDFWLAQQKLSGKTINVQAREEVPLRGVLRCFCGRLVTAGNSKSKTGAYHWYYLCKTHRNNLSAKKLHAQLNQILDALSFDQESLQWFKEKLSERIGQHILERSSNISKLQKELKQIKLKISSTEEKYLLHPELSEKTYVKVMSELKSHEQKIYQDLQEANTSTDIYWDRLNALLPKLADLRHSFEMMPLNKKQEFLKLGFDQQLYHDGKTYRTPYIHDLFATKELILKEKGLLVKDSPVPVLGETPIRRKNGNPVELLEQLAKIFAA